MDLQMYRLTNRQKDKWTDRKTDKSEMDRQAKRQTNRRMKRWTDGQIKR